MTCKKTCGLKKDANTFMRWIRSKIGDSVEFIAHGRNFSPYKSQIYREISDEDPRSKNQISGAYCAGEESFKRQEEAGKLKFV
ncbi:hypothetical protein L1987_61977 [Smallanthus sonchifolius]|uniref:Uncharacterized protein n=1 Tax=Smallanthus sonchifolius TaxID=185202 RepID=A0ACB9C995_9ASTR|nr:hypothetical protein L1987_61977 [Smallanthus sonchifolius]